MRSGIGPAGHLRDVGIEPLLDAPNVGSHLQEHPFAACNWRAAAPVTLDDADQLRHLAQWALTRRGKLTSTLAEAVIHWRSDGGLQVPDFQIYFAPVFFWEHGLRKPGIPALSLGATYLAPESRGTVRLRSADPDDAPRIQNNLLGRRTEVERDAACTGTDRRPRHP